MKFLAFSFCALLCAVLLKDKHRAFALALSVSGVCAVLVSVAVQLYRIVNSVNGLISYYPSSGEYAGIMIKVLAITLLTQLISSICRDNGESALALATETAAKITVIALVMPLFETVIKIVNGLVK